MPVTKPRRERSALIRLFRNSISDFWQKQANWVSGVFLITWLAREHQSPPDSFWTFRAAASERYR